MLSDQRWDDCPAGVINAMLRQRRRDRRQLLTKRVAGVAAVLLLFAVGVTVTSRNSGPAIGEDLTCEAVGQLLVQYHEGQLEADLAHQVELHLRDCPHCRRQYELRFGDEVRERLSTTSAILALATRSPADRVELHP